VGQQLLGAAAKGTAKFGVNFNQRNHR
jgi:hypothetical protein